MTVTDTVSYMVKNVASYRLNRAASQRYRAVTLIEAVLYISIALALIVGGLVFYQQANLSAKMSQQVRAMSAIMSEARAFYSQHSDFIALSGSSPTTLVFNDYLAGERLDDILIASGAVPPSMIADVAGTQTGSRLRNAWGGEMSVRSGRDGANNYVGVQFLMYNVPTPACVRLGPSTPQGNTSWTDMITAVAMFGSRATPAVAGGDITVGGAGATIDMFGTFCSRASRNGVVVMGMRARLF